MFFIMIKITVMERPSVFIFPGMLPSIMTSFVSPTVIQLKEW